MENDFFLKHTTVFALISIVYTSKHRCKIYVRTHSCKFGFNHTHVSNYINMGVNMHVNVARFNGIDRYRIALICLVALREKKKNGGLTDIGSNMQTDSWTTSHHIHEKILVLY